MSQQKNLQQEVALEAKADTKGRVAPARCKDLVENILREEATPATQEEGEENVQINKKDLGPRKDAKAKNIGIPQLNLVFVEQIMTFL